jgi:hypothetical protein
MSKTSRSSAATDIPGPAREELLACADADASGGGEGEGRREEGRE